jgi:hypothetical protein
MKLAKGRVQWRFVLLAVLNLPVRLPKESVNKPHFPVVYQTAQTTDKWMQNNLSRQYDVFK